MFYSLLFVIIATFIKYRSIPFIMLDKEDLKEIRDRMSDYDAQREILIKSSRDLLKLSKQIIYSVHRGEINVAGDLVVDIKKQLNLLNKVVENNPKLVYSGTFKVAVQEFVEAICYYEFVKNNKIPNHKELNVGGEYYLLGLADLTGELVRKAVNSGIDSDFYQVVSIKELVAEIYGEFLKFDFPNGDLRRKFDGMKYDLKKLEDLVFELKIKDKV